MKYHIEIISSDRYYSIKQIQMNYKSTRFVTSYKRVRINIDSLSTCNKRIVKKLAIKFLFTSHVVGITFNFVDN